MGPGNRPSYQKFWIIGGKNILENKNEVSFGYEK